MPRVNARERSPDDYYVEPAWSVRGLLDVQVFSGFTLDPACGSGTIPKVFQEAGLQCDGGDLHDRAEGTYGIQDFLAWDASGFHVDNIVTNPPFDLAEAFIRKALTVAKHKVAIIQRLSFMEGRKRRWIFEETPICAIHPFASRVSMPPGGKGIVAKGGAIAFAWFVFDHSWLIGAPPIVRRIEKGPDDYAPF